MMENYRGYVQRRAFWIVKKKKTKVNLYLWKILLRRTMFVTSILKRGVWIRKKYIILKITDQGMICFVVSCALQIGVDVEECRESGTSKCFKVSNSTHRSREPSRIGQKYKQGVQKSLKMRRLFKKYVVGVVPKSSKLFELF